jgi:signal transduction histidine kinase
VLVKGDPELLRVALQNLVNNARRHSPQTGVVSVRVARQGTLAEMVVEDQGAGIDVQEQPKIFEKFFRGHNALAQPGAGMGLYLVKSIVEQHGGQVMQSNLFPLGCQFKITLPAC